MNRSLDQKRAVYALEFVKTCQRKGSQDKLKTQIHNAPVMIIQNGLGQMLAFLLADNEGKTANNRKPSGWLYDALQTWLCANDRPCRVYHGDEELIEQLVSGKRADYFRAQEEALALFNWLVKFADAWLTGGGK